MRAADPIYLAAMSSLVQPLHLLLMMFSGWVNRHQLDVIDYLQEENRVPRSAWMGAASTSPTPNVDDLREKRVRSAAKY